MIGGYLPDETTSRAIPIYRTATYRMKDTETASNLFALKELGNIYSKLGLFYILFCCLL